MINGGIPPNPGGKHFMLRGSRFSPGARSLPSHPSGRQVLLGYHLPANFSGNVSTQKSTLCL